MTQENINKVASSIVKSIKANLVAAKSNPWDKSVYVEYDSEYDRKAGKYLDYIRVGKDYFRNIGEGRDIENITRQVIAWLEQLRSSRGYKNLVYTTRKSYEGSLWNSREVTYLDRIVVPENPCKEYKGIQAFVKKYGNITLPDYKLFWSRMGGKRGVLWGEEGDRHYLANRPKSCAEVLDALRKSRGSKDQVVCKFGEEDYMDPAERRYSAYHEVECDGEKRSYLQVTIKSPAGKVKYEAKIY